MDEELKLTGLSVLIALALREAIGLIVTRWKLQSEQREKEAAQRREDTSANHELKRVQKEDEVSGLRRLIENLREELDRRTSEHQDAEKRLQKENKDLLKEIRAVEVENAQLKTRSEWMDAKIRRLIELMKANGIAVNEFPDPGSSEHTRLMGGE